MSNENLQKHTLFLRAGDMEFLKDAYGGQGIAASVVIRHIVATFVDNIQKQETPQVSLNLEGITDE